VARKDEAGTVFPDKLDGSATAQAPRKEVEARKARNDFAGFGIYGRERETRARLAVL
jgi:hypothetical protein